NSFPALFAAALPRSEIVDMVSLLTKEYYLELAKCGDDKELKLKAIASYIQKLEVLHPFEDANCRTFVILLLNKLLIENGFSSVILINPNQFDGFSNSQLVTAIKNGMGFFNDYCKTCDESYNKVKELISNDKKSIFSFF